MNKIWNIEANDEVGALLEEAGGLNLKRTGNRIVLWIDYPNEKTAKSVFRDLKRAGDGFVEYTDDPMGDLWDGFVCGDPC